MITAANHSTTTTRPWYRRLLRMACLYGGLPYLSVTLIFFLFQRQLIYRPTVAADLSVATCRIAVDIARDVNLQAKDGAELNGWLLCRSGVPFGTGDSSLVLYFPGNAANRFERLNDLLEFTAADFDVLIFDYRGFGDSEGSPSQSTLESDAKEIWRFAQHELGYQESRIVVFGESLGGAVALSLWSAGNSDTMHPAPAAVILNSTFCSMSDVVAWNYPWFPFGYLLLDRWPSSERIGRVDSSVIVFHGTADELVPFTQGQQLASLAANGRFITVADGTHNSIPMGQIRHELLEIRDRILPVERPEPQSKESSQNEDAPELFNR